MPAILVFGYVKIYKKRLAQGMSLKEYIVTILQFGMGIVALMTFLYFAVKSIY